METPTPIILRPRRSLVISAPHRIRWDEAGAGLVHPCRPAISRARFLTPSSFPGSLSSTLEGVLREVYHSVGDGWRCVRGGGCEQNVQCSMVSGNRPDKQRATSPGGLSGVRVGLALWFVEPHKRDRPKKRAERDPATRREMGPVSLVSGQLTTNLPRLAAYESEKPREPCTTPGMRASSSCKR